MAATRRDPWTSRSRPISLPHPPSPAEALAPASLEIGPPPVDGGPQGSGPAPYPAFSGLRLVGQLFCTYIVLETPGRLLLIDQHAAHERVLFERLREATRAGKQDRHVLLLPLWLEFPHSTAQALLDHRCTLERVGYEIEAGGPGVRGGTRIGLKTVPALLEPRTTRRTPPDWRALLEETASLLASELPDDTSHGGIEGALHHTLATAACHGACRKGDRLDTEAIRGLLRDLDTTVWFLNCQHGRPIVQEISESELARRFLRA